MYVDHNLTLEESYNVHGTFSNDQCETILDCIAGFDDIKDELSNAVGSFNDASDIKDCEQTLDNSVPDEISAVISEMMSPETVFDAATIADMVKTLRSVLREISDVADDLNRIYERYEDDTNLLCEANNNAIAAIEDLM